MKVHGPFHQSFLQARTVMMSEELAQTWLEVWHSVP
jgi:hypothetical protein